MECVPLTMDEETRVTPCWTCLCHRCSVRTEDNRTFDPPLPSNTVYCRCRCAHHPPLAGWTDEQESKALDARLWSVIHTWQVLRGSWQCSQPCQVLWQELETLMLMRPTQQKALPAQEAPHSRVTETILGSTAAHSRWARQNSSSC